MAVQFLVNGIHPDGTSGLVSITRDEWIKILEDNMTLPKEQRRYFYRDAITDNDTRDYIFMEVPRETFFEWTNQDRATYRNYEAQKHFFIFSYDELLEEGMDEPEDTISVEDLAFDRLFISNLKKAMYTSSPWASELIDLYLSERSSEVQKYLIDKYGISRTTAYRHQITFEYRLKKYLKKNETK